MQRAYLAMLHGLEVRSGQIIRRLHQAQKRLDVEGESIKAQTRTSPVLYAINANLIAHAIIAS